MAGMPASKIVEKCRPQRAAKRHQRKTNRSGKAVAQWEREHDFKPLDAGEDDAQQDGDASPGAPVDAGRHDECGCDVRHALVYDAPMYYRIFSQFKKQLGQLDKWLEAAAGTAQTKSFDPNVFLGLRLSPDQFAFARQVQTACDTAKVAASRLTGKDAPSHPDTEQTLDELRARVRAVVTYLDGFSEKDFEGAATRTVTQPRWEGKTMTGADYFLEHALPNFYFHLTHTYAILRHNGVNLGKRDYLGPLSLRAAP